MNDCLKPAWLFYIKKLVINSRGALDTLISKLAWQKSHLVSIDQDIAAFKVRLLVCQFWLTLIANLSNLTMLGSVVGVNAVTWHQHKFESLIIVKDLSAEDLDVKVLPLI